MKTLIGMAILSTLSGCAHRQPTQSQAQSSPPVDSGHQRRLVEIDRLTTHATETRDKALAELGPLVYRQSTQMRRADADRCMADPFTRTDENKRRQCISTVEGAEMDERHDRASYESKKDLILGDFNWDMIRVASKEGMLKMYDASERMARSEAASAASSGYDSAPVNPNPYGTPSPSLYLAPGPGTSITSFGPDMWTARGTSPGGRATTCNGAYGVVSCY